MKFLAVYHPQGNGGCIGYVYFQSGYDAKDVLELKAQEEIGRGNILVTVARVMDESEATEEGRVFHYLIQLRDGGGVNMLGAAQHLVDEFGYSHHDATQWLFKWLDTFSSK
jgi:hypothetical protein